MRTWGQSVGLERLPVGGSHPSLGGEGALRQHPGAGGFRHREAEGGVCGEAQDVSWEEPLGCVCWHTGLQGQEEKGKLERGFEGQAKETRLFPEIAVTQIQEIFLQQSSIKRAALLKKGQCDGHAGR